MAATPAPPPIVLLTREEVKELMKEALRELDEEEHVQTPAPAKALSDEDLSRARKSLRRFGRGA